MASDNRPRIWLHIGMPKTGSTSLQTVLYQQRGLLEKHGFYYPDFGHRQHIAMTRMLAQRAGSKVPFPKAGTCPDTERLLDYLHQHAPEAHTVILSTEYLFQRVGCAPFERPESIQESLATIRRTVECAKNYLEGTKVEVVMWLRRQDKWLMSLYNQTIKSSGYHGDFWDFVDNNAGAYLFEIVSIWADLFGREQVHCFSYDALIEEHKDIVGEFAKLVGLDELLSELAGEDCVVERNTALSPAAMELKKMINAAFDMLAPKVRKQVLMKDFRKIVRKVSDESPNWPHAMLSPAERKKLMSRFLPGNHKLIDDLGYTGVSDLCNISDLDALEVSGNWQRWRGADKTSIQELLALVLPQNANLHRLENQAAQSDASGAK